MSEVRSVFGSGLLHLPHPHRGSPRAGGGDLHATAVLALSCAILFLIGFNTTAVNTALNAIAGELDMGTSELGWTVSVYMLSVASFVVLAGRLGDMFGERRMALAGLAIFAAASFLVAAAESAQLAIAGRALQGIGSAALMPASMAVLRFAYPPERQGFALGIWGATGAFAFGVGPLLGGVLTDEASWRWIWWSSLIVSVGLAVAAVGVMRGMPQPSGRPTFDRAGIVLLPVSLFTLILGLQQGTAWGWDSPRTIGVLALSLIALAALVRIELRKEARGEDPLLHLEVLRNPAIIAANLGTAVNAINLIGVLFFFNLYAQSIFTLDYSAVDASVALLPLGVAMVGASLVIGRVCDRVGFRWPIAIGIALIGVGELLASRIDGGSTFADLWWPTTIVGLGLGMTFSVPAAAGLREVSAAQAGEASGVINVSRYVGASLAISIGSAVYTTLGADELNKSLDAAHLSTIERARLDESLTGAPGQVEKVERSLDTRELRAFRAGSPDGVAAGFAGVMFGLGIVSLLAALAWPPLMRPRAP